MGSYIPDGYTRTDGYIAAKPPEANGESLYGAVAFSYRVATRPESVALDARIEFVERKLTMAATADEAVKHSLEREKMVCDFVANHITDWNLTNGDTPVPISGLEVLRLNDRLTYRLYGIIRCMQTSDPLPPELKGDEMPNDAEMVKN